MSAPAATTPLRTLLVDDEALARDVLRRLAEARDDLEICGECEHGEAALRKLREENAAGRTVDLIFLDVRMPGLDGFELLEELARSADSFGPLPSIVFVTAYDRYAVRAFEKQAVDYLLKPVTPARFEQALERCLENRRPLAPEEVQRLLGDALLAAPERLLIKLGSRIVPVAVHDVDWVEASGDYVRVHCGEKSHLLERSLGEMEKLLALRGFRRVHRSALVNEVRIAQLHPLGSGRYEIELQNGSRLVMSRSYANRYKDELL
ncbi:MAG: LytTR family DNA-binding domain-containing protein [Acidobacteriota bacterium]